MKMIIARLGGGMANQMGIYAAGRALSLQCGATLKLDLSGLEKDSLRKYELNKLNIHAEIATEEEIKAITQESRFKIVNKIKKKIYKRFHIKKPHVYKESSLSFDPSFFKLKPPIYLIGNFPSVYYPLTIFDLLKKEFSISQPLSQQSQAWLNKIGTVCSVAVHVRRGDYVSNPKITAVHGVLGMDYYRRAFDVMLKQQPRAEFFVFSDDPEWVKVNIKPGSIIHYVDCNDSENGFQDYWLMRHCKHHILANSGFSRWAALLCNNQNQVVIRPSRWVNSKQFKAEDVGPSSWILVDS